MELKILYIDDNPDDLDRYSSLIEASSNSAYTLTVTQIRTGSLAENPKIFEETDYPDLILLDFDFSYVDASNRVLGMNGATLSNFLRQEFVDVPIIIITRDEIIRSIFFPHNDVILACIDEIKMKEDLIPPNEDLIRYLITISTQYKILRECSPKSWEKLFQLISAPEMSYESIKQTYPLDTFKEKNEWTVFETVKWLRKTIIGFPGILYDSVNVATYLGISESSFNKNEIQSFFSGAEYIGIFSGERKFWWKSLLFEIAVVKMNDDERVIPVRKIFHKFWERTNNGMKLEKSKCIFSGESPADTVCYILNQPVMKKFSIRYNPDNRPPIMDEARVSFAAIKSRNTRINYKYFDELGKRIIEEKKLKP